jgi:two-component system LytT family sensor kinase
MPDSRHELHAPNPFRLRPGELLAIVAFWAFLAVLTAAGRVVDPRIPNLSPEFSSALVSLAFIEYTIWALLTVPIILAVNRISGTVRRPRMRTLTFMTLGIVIAIAVDTSLRGFRYHLLPLPPGREWPPFGFGNITRFEFLDDFMVYVAILGAALARDYFLRYQARLDETRDLQAQLAEAQLAVLRTQLNPHFLFNTLNAIATLVDTDPRGVRRMIARLGDLLRHTLEETNEQEVTLARETELLRRYLDIMEVRFQGGLEVRIEIDPTLNDALVPNLILQPLVENAFKHGLSGLEKGGRVEVRARHDGDDVVLTVRDNGPGPGTTEDGVGITNTRARLVQLYGENQGFALRAAGDGSPGAIAEVRLPYHVAPLPRSSARG